MGRDRLDRELVRRGLARSRVEAVELVLAGRVRVSGAPAGKPARLVHPGEPILVEPSPTPGYVSRGGEKLAHALARFDLAVADRRALDIGASTGGFSDCLLQHGVRQVVAVDSGHGQLDPRLRADPRVVALERTNARTLLVAHPELARSFDLVVADVSFISLSALAPTLVGALAPGGQLVALVKPQFEVGRAEASRGRGVVRDPVAREAAVQKVAESLADHGAPIVAAVASPLLGPAGNAEIFVLAVPGAPRDPQEGEVIHRAVASCPDLVAGGATG
jgi:23S rRNA (cytidine1920-2'-O)/16S rRNA (cytidine1409-2'-O)-methyltransferase